MVVVVLVVSYCDGSNSTSSIILIYGQYKLCTNEDF